MSRSISPPKQFSCPFEDHHTVLRIIERRRDRVVLAKIDTVGEPLASSNQS